MPDMPGQVATGRDTDFTITIEEAAELYAKAGHPRTLRTVQRYCASGHLDCMKAATALGDKYYVAPQSVARHIAQIVELSELDGRPTFRDVSRPVVPPAAEQPSHTPMATSDDVARQAATPQSASNPQNSGAEPERQAPAEPADVSRQDATDAIAVTQLKMYEREVERLRDDREFLQQQFHTKDRQIEALLERDKETNYLVQGLQQLLKPLLGAPQQQADRTVPPDERPLQ